MKPGRRATAAAGTACAVAVAVALSGGGDSTSDAPGTKQARAGAKGLATIPSARVSVRDDAEIGSSFATSPDVTLTEKAPSPADAKAKTARQKIAAGGETEDNFVSPGAPTDNEIAAELKQMEAAQRTAGSGSGGGGGSGGLTLQSDGTVKVAPGVPTAIARLVAGANAIAKFPYVYGGGHGSFVDTAYDCSGSLSYALAAGGFLDTTKTSGDLARGGEPGPGKWITIYANAGHTFMVVDGIRYDTSGRGGPLGTRWNASPRSTAGFKVRHPKGY